MRKTFDQLKTKASITAADMFSMFLGQPVYTSTRIDKMTEASYERNEWVFACVSAIATAASSIPLVVFQKQGDEVVEMHNHPLQLLLDKPNETQSRVEFIEAAISFIQIAGNNYIEMNGPNKGGIPTELHLWRPDRTVLVMGAEGPTHARYSVSGSEVDMDFEHCIHTKNFSALDDVYGMSPIQVGRFVIDMDNSTSDWNTSLVQNYAAPSGFMTTPETLPNHAYERMKAMLRRAFGGGRNVGKVHLLEGGAQWQQLGLNPKDMDFINSRKMTRESICALYRVPPQIAGIHETSTYNNYAEARQSFYQETVLPELDKLIASLNIKLAPRFGENVFIGYKREQIEALQDNEDSLFKRLKDAKWMTINEKRQKANLPEVAMGDVFAFSESEVFIHGDTGAVTKLSRGKPIELTVPNAEGGSGNDTGAKPEAGNDNGKAAGEQDIVKKINEFAATLEQRTKNQRAQIRFDNLLDKHSDILEGVMKQHFNKELSALLDANTNNDSVLFDIIKDNEEQLIVDVTARCYLAAEDAMKRERNAMLKVYAEADEGKSLTKFDEYDFAFIEQEMHEYVYNYVAADITAVSMYTKERVTYLVGESIAAGESVGQLASRLALEYEGFSMVRAHMIARTEMLTAVSYGRQQGALTLGEPMTKTWLTDGTARTRASHKRAKGQTVLIHQPYNIGDEYAQFPGDPSLSGKERIRCRCTEYYDLI